MKSASVKILAVVTIALVLLLAMLQYQGSESTRIDDPLYPGLRDRVNDATSLSILRAGEDGEIRVRKTADTWVMVTRGDYPADVGKLRELLLTLADAKLVERKTANPANHDQLGLRDPSVEYSKGTRLRIDGTDVDLILGNVAQPGYRYARKSGDDQSWLIDKDPTLPDSAADWLLSDLIDIKSDAVRSVTIEHAGGETIRVARESAEQTDVVIEGIPEGRELSYPTVGNGIAGALNALAFEDVRAGDGFGDDATVTTFETFAGATIEIRSQEDDGGQWITIAASAEDDANDTVVDIDARTAGWQYRIADFKANQLTRRWEDILKAEAEADDIE